MIKKIKKIIPWINMSEKILNIQNRARKYYEKGNIKLAKYLEYKIYRKYHCWISCSATLGKNIQFPHPIGIVIGEKVKIDDNVIIYQNVTLGRKKCSVPEYPQIGKNVVIYCNSTIVGNIFIGENSIIGCNSVVLKSVKNGSKCIGVVK